MEQIFFWQKFEMEKIIEISFLYAIHYMIYL